MSSPEEGCAGEVWILSGGSHRGHRASLSPEDAGDGPAGVARVFIAQCLKREDGCVNIMDTEAREVAIGKRKVFLRSCPKPSQEQRTKM